MGNNYWSDWVGVRVGLGGVCSSLSSVLHPLLPPPESLLLRYFSFCGPESWSLPHRRADLNLLITTRRMKWPPSPLPSWWGSQHPPRPTRIGCVLYLARLPPPLASLQVIIIIAIITISFTLLLQFLPFFTTVLSPWYHCFNHDHNRNMTVIVITTSHSHTGIDMDAILIDYGC